MTSSSKECSILPCEEKQATCTCHGCSKSYCDTHLTEHRKILCERVCNSYNSFKQKFDDIKKSSIEESERWENDSIEKIKQTATQYRQKLNETLSGMEKQIETINKRLKLTGEEEKIDEPILITMDQEIKSLKKNWKKPKKF